LESLAPRRVNFGFRSRISERRQTMYPKDYRYTKDHEWVKVEGDTAAIGITEFAQKQLGDVVYVELPAVGKTLDVHQTIGVVESVKAVSDVYSPLSGEVIAVNEDLNNSPETLNQDPHGKGWIIRLRLKDKAEVDNLLAVGDYERFLEGLAS
jgi:glycine cleavage system H protein